MKLVLLCNSLIIIFMYAPGSSSAAVCGHAWIVSVVNDIAIIFYDNSQLQNRHGFCAILLYKLLQRGEACIYCKFCVDSQRKSVGVCGLVCVGKTQR